jgi:protein SCO1/2
MESGAILLASVLLLVSAVLPAEGHVAPPAPGGAAPPAAPAAGAVPAPSIELSERIGSRIPLDAAFRDESGRSVRLSELVTGPTIVLPVYYGCPNVCSFLQMGLARVLPALRLHPGTDYRVLSISIDDTDGPAAAARAKGTYLQAMNAPFPQEGWRFLTGDNASIRKVTDAAGYPFERQGNDFLHPVASFVVTRDGTIVRYLYGTDFLAKDLALAFLEAREGRTGRSIRKVVQYCFSFDPKGKTYVFNLLRVSATAILATAGAFLAFLLLGGKRRGKGRGTPGAGAPPASTPPGVTGAAP